MPRSTVCRKNNFSLNHFANSRSNAQRLCNFAYLSIIKFLYFYWLFELVCRWENYARIGENIGYYRLWLAEFLLGSLIRFIIYFSVKIKFCFSFHGNCIVIIMWILRNDWQKKNQMENASLSPQQIENESLQWCPTFNINIFLQSTRDPRWGHDRKRWVIYSWHIQQF
jgi:hypothetical protein